MGWGDKRRGTYQNKMLTEALGHQLLSCVTWKLKWDEKKYWFFDIYFTQNSVFCTSSCYPASCLYSRVCDFHSEHIQFRVLDRTETVLTYVDCRLQSSEANEMRLFDVCIYSELHHTQHNQTSKVTSFSLFACHHQTYIYKYIRTCDRNCTITHITFEKEIFSVA